ncbi:MAG: hypothetical protein WDO17_19700 [Alphaproteobacteria bacterium]
MNPNLPPIGRAAAQAWRDVGQVIKALPWVSLVTFAICAGLVIAQDALMPDHGSRLDATAMLADLTVSLPQALLFTPYLIAVHRFIILGEVTAHYALDLRDPRFLRFFGWSVALSVLTVAPTPLAALLTSSDGARFFIVCIIAAIAIMISIRTILLFPSTAVDSPGATLINAMADSRGYAWRIVFIVLLAMLPVIVAAIVVAIVLAVAGVLSDGPKDLSLSVIASGILLGALSFLLVSFAVVVASRLYQWLGRRTKGAPA